MTPEAWSAVATGAAVVVALGFGASAEWRLLADRRERRRREEVSQAQRVSAWTADGDVFVVVLNGSDEPIWDVTVHAGSGTSARTLVVGFAPPGSQTIPVADTPSLVGQHTRVPVPMTFRDSSGRAWRRDAAGRLHRTQGGI